MATDTLQNDVLSYDLKYLNPDDDEARKKIAEVKAKAKEFRDLDITFLKNPNNGNLFIRTGAQAVKQSIKLLMLTDFGERLMKPGVGSSIKTALFDPVDFITERNIESYIREVIENFEPRAELLNVTVSAKESGYDVTIVFNVVNENEPVQLNTFLKVIRN
tara:strand:- start:230 stop:712 length:483 start_codon:yes stop_codon:yes gene_type:complete